MKFVFYNTFAIGDIYFAEPFLKQICKSNPHIAFQIHTNLGSYILRDIPNLSQVDESDGDFGSPTRYSLFKFFEAHAQKPWFQQNDTLFINTWVVPLNRYIEPSNCECHPENLYLAFQRLIADINSHLEEKLAFLPMEKKELLYSLPPPQIDRFLEYQRNCGKKTIYYHNRMGMSASSKPFTDEKDHIRILQTLSTLYPNAIIIVPNHRILPACPNIVCVTEFGIHEHHRCKNIFEDMEVAGHCTYAIFFDMGSAYLYCNPNFKTYTAKIYHLSKEDRFPLLMKHNLESCLSYNTDSIEYVPCSTPDDVLEEIQKRIQP